MRRFPPPWTIDDLPGGYVVRDASGQRLAYVYGRQDTAGISDALSLDEVRRIAAGAGEAQAITALEDAAELVRLRGAQP